jgi:hypothetical protein
VSGSWRTSAAAASAAALAAGAGTGALTDTLGHTGSGTALAVGGVAVAAVAAANLATGTRISRNGASFDGKMKQFLDEDWPEIRWADIPRGLVDRELNASGSLGTYVYSRWCETSRSLQSADQVLAGLPLPDLSRMFGRATLNKQGHVTSRSQVFSALQFFAGEPGEVRWVGFRGTIMGSQPTEDGPWTHPAVPNTETSGESVQLRFLLVAISLPSYREHILVGVASPMSSLTEAMFGLVRERFDAQPATPRLQVQDLIRPGIQVRSARFAAPGGELLERYKDQAGFFEHASRLNEREIEGVTLELSDASVNIFSDGQIYLHNVPPENVPIIMSIVAPVIWPRSG